MNVVAWDQLMNVVALFVFWALFSALDQVSGWATWSTSRLTGEGSQLQEATCL